MLTSSLMQTNLILWCEVDVADYDRSWVYFLKSF